MATAPSPRHNGGPLSEEDGCKLLGHIRALESLDEQRADLLLDVKARRELAADDGFDPKALTAIVKRRKLGPDKVQAADLAIRLYEEAIEERR